MIPLSAIMMAMIMTTAQVLTRSNEQTQDDKAFTPAVSFCYGKRLHHRRLVAFDDPTFLSRVVIVSFFR